MRREETEEFQIDKRQRLESELARKYSSARARVRNVFYQKYCQIKSRPQLHRDSSGLSYCISDVNFQLAVTYDKSIIGI